MGKINSKQKGARGERNFAEFLRGFGYEAERGCQHAGGKDSPDVKTNMIGVHWEVKRTERLNLYGAMEQSRRDAGDGEMSPVAHRKNNKPWVIIQDAEEWMKLYQAWEREQKGQNK